MRERRDDNFSLTRWGPDETLDFPLVGLGYDRMDGIPVRYGWTTSIPEYPNNFINTKQVCLALRGGRASWHNAKK